MSDRVRMKDSPGKYLRVAKLSLQTAITYRANVLIGFVFYAMFLYVFFNLWRAIYAGGNVEGYTLTQMIWYLCITELISFGMRTRIHTEITNDVKSGAIAYQLNRPYKFIRYQFANALGGIVMNVTLFTILALIMGFSLVGPIDGFSFRTLPFGILSLLLGMGLNFFMLLAIGLTSFFIEENFGIYLIFSKLVFMTGTFIPVEFLPTWLQGIARVLPFSYVTWAPAKLIVAFDMKVFLQVVPVQAVYLAAAIVLCEWMYRRGVKNLQAHGG